MRMWVGTNAVARPLPAPLPTLPATTAGRVEQANAPAGAAVRVPSTAPWWRATGGRTYRATTCCGQPWSSYTHYTSSTIYCLPASTHCPPTCPTPAPPPPTPTPPPHHSPPQTCHSVASYFVVGRPPTTPSTYHRSAPPHTRTDCLEPDMDMVVLDLAYCI